MPKYFELTGPAFVGLKVPDVKAAADFYEKTLGFRRDPEVFPNKDSATRAKKGNIHDRAEQFSSPVCPT